MSNLEFEDDSYELIIDEDEYFNQYLVTVILYHLVR
jgi:hypothetical protein